MTETRIAEIESPEEWDDAVALLRQLWSDADDAFVRSWVEEADYRPFGLYADGDLVAVAGVSIQRVLHHARHAWVHDLVVDAERRGEGHGSELLSFVAGWARERDCEHLALAVRTGNDDATAFYEANDLQRWGHVMETVL